MLCAYNVATNTVLAQTLCEISTIMYKSTVAKLNLKLCFTEKGRKLSGALEHYRMSKIT